jgi:hypothetical protein
LQSLIILCLSKINFSSIFNGSRFACSFEGNLIPINFVFSYAHLFITWIKANDGFSWGRVTCHWKCSSIIIKSDILIKIPFWQTYNSSNSNHDVSQLILSNWSCLWEIYRLKLYQLQSNWISTKHLSIAIVYKLLDIL